MGLNVSQIRSQIISDTKSYLQAKNCQVSSNQTIDVGGDVILENLSCKNINVLNNFASYDQSCVYDGTIKAIKTLASKNSAVAKSLLGLSIAATDTDLMDKIDQKIDTECGIFTVNQKATYNANLIFKNITCENMDLANQVVNAKSACAVRVAGEVATNISQEAIAESTQGFSTATIVMIIIVAVVILLIVVIIAFKESGGSAAAAVAGSYGGGIPVFVYPQAPTMFASPK